MEGKHRVVVVGGGFGGLYTAQALRKAPVAATLIDRRNFHLFQPLSYQVATGALSPSDVAYPLRALFKSDPNVRVLMAQVAGFDLARREVRLAGAEVETLGYDTLIVAAGSSYSYFGHEEWRDHAAEVKSLESAVTVRSRILDAFERAELATDPARREMELTFVIVGGGPTGVEMAGQIGELSRDTLASDFRSVNTRSAKVLIVEMTDRLLGGFPKQLAEKAARALQRVGVTPMLGQQVVAIDSETVTLQDGDGNRQTIPCATVVWAAGVTASGLAASLGEATGAEVDKAGRLTVEPDLTLPGHPEVFALGDMVRVRAADGEVRTFPGVAPVAIQQGVYAARTITARLKGNPTKPFHYRDKGNVATVGRGQAVVDLGWLRLSGFPAWVLWLVIHIWYLIGFQNRLLVVVQWTFSFLTHGRSGRLIVDTPDHAPTARLSEQAEAAAD
jgi:NADH dehydrogenase